MVQAERASEEQGAAGRTPADVSTLLVELGRALKGWSFYPPEHPARKELLDRAWRAWVGELRRGGPLELEIRRGAFWLPGAEAPISSGRADDSARQLFVRSVRRIVFDPALDAETLAAFLDVLATEADSLDDVGGFESAFYAGPRRGIQVNEADWRALLESRRVSEGDDVEVTPDFVDGGPSLDASSDAGSDALSEAAGAAAAAGVPLASLLDTLGAATQVAAEGQVTAEGAAEPAPSPGQRLRELDTALAGLEACRDDLAYRDLVRSAVALAEELLAEEETEGAYRLLVTLSHHAGDDAQRSYAQRETALQFLEHVAHGAALEELIGRAVAPDGEYVLEATTALRELGARVAPMILDQLEIESDPERRARLAGVLIAMGEEAVPALAQALVAGGERRMRVALRLAGETQNPRLVESLGEALLRGEREIAREAAQALVRIGDVGALEVLTEALGSARPAVAALAAYSLGTTGRRLALGPLVDTLGRALAQGQLGLARETVRGLGRLGRAEAVPALAELLGRGGLFRRKRLREVKLAAVSALTHLPGREAEQALVRAARARDGRLREAAQAALRRRAQEEAAGRLPSDAA